MRTTEADASNFDYPKDGGHANDWKDRSVATEQYLKGNLGVQQMRKIRSNRAQSTEYYMHTDPTAANRRRATPVTNEGRGITRDQTWLAPELVSQLRQSWKAEKTERLAPSPSHHNGEAGVRPIHYKPGSIFHLPRSCSPPLLRSHVTFDVSNETLQTHGSHLFSRLPHLHAVTSPLHPSAWSRSIGRTSEGSCGFSTYASLLV